MGFSVAGRFMSPVPKVDTAAHPPLGSALCYRQTIYIPLNGKTPVSQKTMMAFSLLQEVFIWIEYAYQDGHLKFSIFFFKLWPATNVLYC